jgi:hypothetical protein
MRVRFARYCAVPPAAAHSDGVREIQPCPLHEFMPLQLWLALLHSDCPLHPFAPVHITFASAAKAGVDAATVPNRAAAESASATPIDFFVLESMSLYSLKNKDY